MKVNIYFKTIHGKRYDILNQAAFFILFTGILVFGICLQASATPDPLNVKSKITNSLEKVFNDVEKLAVLNQSIEGVVTDAATGKPLSDVSVMIKGSSTGTTTNASGHFQLEVPDDAVLVISSIGYENKEVSVNGKVNLRITLSPTSTELTQVVVMGYGITQKKQNLTAAVDVVSGEVLQDRPGATVGDLLMGVSPNLTIQNSGRAGEPGAGNQWNLRGLGTISGSSSPLILIDGVEGDPNNLDPASIKSVTVLKDAAAASIYGSRAAFGVVLITTKDGQKGKLKVQYNTNLSWSKPVHVADQYPSNIWGVAFNQMQANSGLPPAYTPEQMDRINGYIAGTYTPEYDTANPPKSIFWGRLEGNANWNWPGIFLKNWAFANKHNISLSGGEGNTQFYVSGGYYNQQGTYRWGNDSYNRYNFLSNISSQATDWMRVDFGVRYAQTKTDYPLGVAGRRDRWRDINMIYKFSPISYYYLSDGVTVANPVIVSMKESGRDVSVENNLVLNLGVELEPIKGWKTNVRYHYNYGANDYAQNQIPVIIPTPDGKLFNWGYRNPAALSAKSSRNYYTVNATTSYERNIAKHFIKLLVGGEQELNQTKYLYGHRDGLISIAVPSINAATGEMVVDASSEHWSTRAAFGRLDYNFDDKYLFQLTGRFDGTSRFPEGKRWSFFPTVSAGYVISQEKFWKPIDPIVNFLKIRASYGSLGNQNVGNYLYLPLVPVGGQLDDWLINGERPPYATAPRIISASLTWETITTLNLGFDLRALNNRLGLDFNWFNRETINMFGPTEDLPAVLGTGAPKENNASLETKGFEVSVDWRDDINKDLSYNFKINLGNYKTKITKYRNPQGFIDGWYVGKTYGEIWGYETGGMIQTQSEADKMADQTEFYSEWGPGDIMYQDLNGDGFVNDGGRTLDSLGDLRVIGNDQPQFNIGALLGMEWKGFGFNMFWEGMLKRNFWPDRQDVMFWGLVGGGFPGSESAVLKGTPVLDYWRPADETNILGPNTNAYLPKPYANSGQRRKNQLTQTRYLLNAAYLRLKNVQIYYNIPKRLSQKVSVENIRVYVSASNVLDISSLPEGYDPETMFYSAYTQSLVYPLSKQLSCGLNVTF